MYISIYNNIMIIQTVTFLLSLMIIINIIFIIFNCTIIIRKNIFVYLIISSLKTKIIFDINDINL